MCPIEAKLYEEGKRTIKLGTAQPGEAVMARIAYEGLERTTLCAITNSDDSGGVVYRMKPLPLENVSELDEIGVVTKTTPFRHTEMGTDGSTLRVEFKYVSSERKRYRLRKTP